MKTISSIRKGRANHSLGLLILFICLEIGSCGLLTSRSGNLTIPVVENKKVLLQLEPIRPKTPDCFTYFPGTPAWGDCMERFQLDMAEFQAKMHEYVKTKTQEEGGTNGGVITQTNAGPGQYYSESSYNANSMSTSNAFVGGYAIKAVNMPTSTSIVNGVLKVTFRLGNIEQFDSKVNNNVIELSVVSRGQKKWASITVPKDVKISDVQVDRSADAIYVTGPTRMSGGNYQMFQSGSSSSNSMNFDQNYGQFQNMGQFGPNMPGFQQGFQNMFQNMFQNIFGGRAMQGPGSPRSMNFPPYFPAQQMWFY